MTRLRELLGDPRFLRGLHGWATIFWLCNYPLLVVLWRFPKALLAYTALCSVYANKVGHWGSWQTARVEVKEDEELQGIVRLAVAEALRHHDRQAQ